MLLPEPGDAAGERLAIGLTTLAMALLSAGLFLAQPGTSELGWIGDVHLSYYAGVAVGTLALGGLALARPRSRAGMALFAFLFLALIAIPAIATGLPRAPTPYRFWGLGAIVLDTGQIQPELYRDHNWPITPLLATALQGVADVPRPFALVAYPILYGLLTGSLAAAVFWALGQPRSHAWIGGSLVLVLNSVQQDFFAGQSVAFVTLLLTLWACMHVAFGSSTTPRGWMVVAGLGIVSIVTGHLLTSLLLIAFLAVLALILLRMPSHAGSGVAGRHIFVGGLFVFALASMVFYSTTVSAAWLSGHAERAVTRSFDLRRVFEESLLLATSGHVSFLIDGLEREPPTAHLALVVLRAGQTLLVGVVAVVLVLLGRRGLSPAQWTILALLPIAGVLAVAFSYNGEGLIRGAMFGVLPFALALLTLARRHRAPLLMLLVLLAPLHLPAHYGNDAAQVVTEADEATWGFAFEHLPRGTVLVPVTERLSYGDRGAELRYSSLSRLVDDSEAFREDAGSEDEAFAFPQDRCTVVLASHGDARHYAFFAGIPNVLEVLRERLASEDLLYDVGRGYAIAHCPDGAPT